MTTQTKKRSKLNIVLDTSSQPYMPGYISEAQAKTKYGRLLTQMRKHLNGCTGIIDKTGTLLLPECDYDRAYSRVISKKNSGECD